MFDIFYIGKSPKILNSIQVDSIQDAQNMSRTRFCWVLNYLCDYTDFNFLWEPKPWEANQRHAWSSQWQCDSETYLIPKNGFNETNYHSDVIPRIPNSNTVYMIDHNNPDAFITAEQLSNTFNNVSATRFISSYLGTLKRIVGKLNDGYIWITSSLCNYSEFDFSWHPEIWQNTMLHVFPSNEQQFGDTFLINVSEFNKNIKETELLEWYDTINFVSGMSIPRWDIPIVSVGDDSIVGCIKAYNFTDPVVLFTNNDTKKYDIPTINLWREKTRTAIPLSTGGNTALVPRDAKNHIIEQVYDYPYVSKKSITYLDAPIDIVFISNGESNAEQNWNHLLKVTQGIPNEIKRVNGVDGRVQAYQEAAILSNTAWFFAVFAKLEVNVNFDWNWQPDRLQQSKHYIFHAKNPITGLEYGHMAMIAYNKDLVLNNNAHGLDFTLDQEHEVVPILSGTAYYADSIEVAWRSAFREVIKLKDSNSIDNEYRLQKWLDSSGSELGIWSQRGAEDAVEYYNTVNGDFSKLRLTYEWKWLDEYFSKKYNEEHVR